MKKLPRLRKKATHDHKPARITNETVAEHRERILAGGRRFKYPMQYARHRLVFNTIIISGIALVILGVLLWWQLYPVQNSSTFFYRITRVLPLPVAVVDGESVPYSNYLSTLRSQVHYLQVKENINLNSVDSKNQIDFIKRKAMDGAIADAYASKLAREKNIKVTTKQIDDAIMHQRQSHGGTASQETYDAVVLDLYDWSPQEAREETSRKLLRQEVAYAIDSTATRQRDEVLAKLQTEKDFDKVAAAQGGAGSSKVTAGMTPFVPRDNQDGGLAAMAASLQKGEISKAFRSTTGDGYYVVKLLDANNDGRISYAYIKIPLTEFNNRLAKVKSDQKVKEHISVPAVKQQPDAVQ